jgi:hypothetical protein
VLGARGVSGDERQVDAGLRHGRQLLLGLHSRLREALHGLAVLAQVDALIALEVGHEPVHDLLVEIVAAQVRVAAGGQHLEHAVANLRGAGACARRGAWRVGARKFRV